MSQINVNPPSSGPVVTNDGGFGAGMIIGIILLILIVIVLILFAGPQIFKGTGANSPGPSNAPAQTQSPAPAKTFLDIQSIA